MKVCVIGIGYIGLPTACILSNNNFQVVGVDIDSDYLEKLKNSNYIFLEEGIEDLINKSLMDKSLILQLKPEKSDVFIICVPTPLGKDNISDLSYLESALISILPFIEKGNLIIIESTIPPLTINNFVIPIIDKSNLIPGIDIFLGYCPERVSPNNIIYELINNNRIVGGFSEKCGNLIADFYKQFIRGEISVTSSKIAEMVKLAENSYRDVNIALSNELAMICNDLDIDPYEVIELANKHPRVSLLDFGIGVGGHCLPVDSYFIIDKVPEKSKLLRTSRSINDNMPSYIAEKVEKRLIDITNPKIAIWGVSYKSDTDDIRNSPAIDIINILKEKGYNVSVFDPYIQGINTNKIQSIYKADILLLLVDHKVFREEDYNMISTKMNNSIILDVHKIIDSKNINSNISLYNFSNI